jgi:hypothetical protein
MIGTIELQASVIARMRQAVFCLQPVRLLI